MSGWVVMVGHQRENGGQTIFFGVVAGRTAGGGPEPQWAAYNNMHGWIGMRSGSGLLQPGKGMRSPAATNRR